ncbi:helix-hairpin-helix domain-containing protein [Streptomyces sp. NPDC005438]|uniref:helix-hairpin-helix domain-containing protein n=1 Tax=Streptomyces sp. NPDC005438 TaxID=3156880 RepID=UPI0033BF7B89
MAAATASPTTPPAVGSPTIRQQATPGPDPTPRLPGSTRPRVGTEDTATSPTAPSRSPEGSSAPPGTARRLVHWARLRCGVEPRTLIALALVLLLLLAFAGYRFWSGGPEPVSAPSAAPTPAPTSGADPLVTSGASPHSSAPQGGARRVVVDVSGKVRRPGIHRLPAGSRVEDALKAAGGVRSGTDTKGLNRARLLVDGEQIVVGSAQQPTGAGPEPGAGPAQSGAPVSLSSATTEQLETLPGVGPVLAQKIVDFRNEHGGFTSVDQLREVSGIGDRRFDELQPRVTP